MDMAVFGFVGRVGGNLRIILPVGQGVLMERSSVFDWMPCIRLDLMGGIT